MEANVVIVGGGPAGLITALTAKSVYPDKSVWLIKEIGDGVIPCAIPYMMHSMPDPKENAMGNQPLEKAGVKVIVAKVVSLDTKKRNVTIESGDVISYERLVLATGTNAVLPPIPGVDKEGDQVDCRSHQHPPVTPLGHSVHPSQPLARRSLPSSAWRSHIGGPRLR